MPSDKITRKEISTRWTISGLEVSTMANGFRESCLYVGYSKHEAIKEFLVTVNGINQ